MARASVDTNSKQRQTQDDDEDERPAKGQRGGQVKGSGAVSLDDDDAVDVGLFGSGRATIAESTYAQFDYGGGVRNPPIVWLVRYERGSGKQVEVGEQPYGMGKGWSLDKRSGALVSSNGSMGIGKTTNAIIYMTKPLKKACEKAGIPYPDFTDPHSIEGAEVEVERIDQEARNITDDKDSNRTKPRDENKVSTILVIKKIISAPWAEESGKKGGSGKSKRARDEEDEDEKPVRGKGGKGKDADEDDEEDAGEDFAEEAVEAIMSAVEDGKVKVGTALEEALEEVLKGRKDMAKIIDLATSPKFLKNETGWTYDGKYVDAKGEEENEDEEKNEKPRRGRK